MANTYVGAGILWGNASASGSLVGLGTLTLLQTAETRGETSKELIADASGNTKTAVYFDHKRRATLEFVPTSGSNVGTLAATTSAILAGTTITLVDALCTPINGTWIIDEEPTLTLANNKAMMARIDLVKFINNSFP